MIWQKKLETGEAKIKPHTKKSWYLFIVTVMDSIKFTEDARLHMGEGVLEPPDHQGRNGWKPCTRHQTKWTPDIKQTPDTRLKVHQTQNKCKWGCL